MQNDEAVAAPGAPLGPACDWPSRSVPTPRRKQRLAVDVKVEIVERTDGILLFVEEGTKAMLEAEGEVRR